MHGNRRFAAVTRSLVMVAVFVAFSSPFAGSADAGDKKKNIELALKVGTTAKPYITVRPRDAKIWRNKPGKPKNVRWWWTVNKTSYAEIFWEIRYEPSKGGGTANYFGDVDIECGQAEIKVQPDKMPDSPNAEWPYSITAYACANGVKAQKLATLNPRIIWAD